MRNTPILFVTMHHMRNGACYAATCISDRAFEVRHYGVRYVLVGCDNIILGKRWNLQNVTNLIYYHQSSSINGEELRKTYSLYKNA